MSSSVDQEAVHAPWAPLLARTILGITILGVVAGIWFSILDPGKHTTDFLLVFSFGLFPFVGYLLAIRRPDNSVSWLMLGIGACLGLDAFLGSFASYAIHGGAGGYHLGAIVEAIEQPSWIPIVALPATFLLLLFPEGHLPSPRWRWFARILGASMVLAFFGIVFAPGPLTDSAFPTLQNPLGAGTLSSALSVGRLGLLMLPIGVVGSLVSLVQRFRHSSGIERLQLRWLVTAAAMVAILYALALVLSFSSTWSSTDTWLGVLQTVAVASFGLIPVAIGISVLRYHLFDIDLVINRALLFGAMALFITAVYISIVVGVGAIVGSQASPVLSAAAAAIVALAFQPARRRAQRVADRLVYGERATPYEVLSEFSKRIGSAYANDELLPRISRALAEGTGASRAEVLVNVTGELRTEAVWPPEAEGLAPLPVAAAAGGFISASSMVEPVRHQDEILGALSITKRAGDSITPTEAKLVRDLAAQAGLVMRNVGLTEQLMENNMALRASRQRLVTAQDEGRRKIERNLHDGAQQQIVALTVKLRLFGQLVDRDMEKAKSMATELQVDAADALEQLRDLARGIYPPLLADRGLVAALEAQARKASVATEVRSLGVTRYPQDIEAAVYFCVLEAMNNVAKYSGANATTITLVQADDDLSFEVLDDGTGFDPEVMDYGTGLQGMADRLDAIGGTLQVSSRLGEGTCVAGRLPAGTAAARAGRSPKTDPIDAGKVGRAT